MEASWRKVFPYQYPLAPGTIPPQPDCCLLPDGRSLGHIMALDMQTLQAYWTRKPIEHTSDRWEYSQNKTTSPSIIFFEIEQACAGIDLVEEARHQENLMQSEFLATHLRVSAAIHTLALCHVLLPTGEKMSRLKETSMEDAVEIRTMEGRATQFLQHCYERRASAIEDDVRIRDKRRIRGTK